MERALFMYSSVNDVLVYSSSYRACTVDFVSCQCNYASLSCSDSGTPGGGEVSY